MNWQKELNNFAELPKIIIFWKQIVCSKKEKKKHFLVMFISGQGNIIL